jgi:hypothetical protein
MERYTVAGRPCQQLHVRSDQRARQTPEVGRGRNQRSRAGRVHQDGAGSHASGQVPGAGPPTVRPERSSVRRKSARREGEQPDARSFEVPCGAHSAKTLCHVDHGRGRIAAVGGLSAPALRPGTWGRTRAHKPPSQQVTYHFFRAVPPLTGPRGSPASRASPAQAPRLPACPSTRGSSSRQPRAVRRPACLVGAHVRPESGAE